MHSMVRIKSTKATAVAESIAIFTSWMKSKLHIYSVALSLSLLSYESLNDIAILAFFSAAHFYHIEIRYQCAVSASVDKQTTNPQ